MNRKTFVIVGASMAGAKAVETLRSEGFDGQVVIMGEEPVRPYERPPLSKGYLRKETEREKVFVHDEGFYQDHDIDLRISTRVSAIDPARATVTTDRGDSVGYDRLLIATGAEPRLLPVPGADLHGVHYLRSIDDSDSLQKAIQDATRVVVVGAGWIGCEVAASARQMGREVAIIEAAAAPLVGVIGPEAGAVFRDLHLEHGVELHMNSTVRALVGGTSVEGVRTDGGTVVAGDLVVIGVGARPRVELAVAAGLNVDNGITVDEHLQTSHSDIYSAGDVANAFHPLFQRRVRVEHWSNARHQGTLAARNMLGQGLVYDRIPYFFSDQYDLGMEYSGYATDWDEVVFRGNPQSREFIAFWLAEGTVLAGMNVNVWDVADSIQALVRSGHRFEKSHLTDMGVSLDTLVAESK